jgi:hypothetical protein
VNHSRVHTIDYDGPIYTAIVIEEDFKPSPSQSMQKVRYNTRSKGVKHEYRERDRDHYTEEDEEYQEDHELSEDYFSGDDDVLVAQRMTLFDFCISLTVRS